MTPKLIPHTFVAVDSQALAEWIDASAAPRVSLKEVIEGYLRQTRYKLNFEVPEIPEALPARLAVFRSVSDALNKGHAVDITFVDDDPTTPGGYALAEGETDDELRARVYADLQTKTHEKLNPTRKPIPCERMVDACETDEELRERRRAQFAAYRTVHPYVRGKWEDPTPPELRVRFRESGDVCDELCVKGGGICSAFTDCKNR